jgi:hypothetical protein
LKGGIVSYDLHLLRLSSTGDPLSEVSALLEQEEEEDEINPGPPVPEKEARKNDLAERLCAANPPLERFAFGFAEVARLYNCTEEEARVKYRHVELNGPEDGNGIQITLFDDTASIAVPYWHQADGAKTVFAEIWRYLAVLAEHGGFSAYDPQLDRLLDLSKDQPAVLQAYGSTMEQVQGIADDGQAPKKPWWKFW